MSQEATKREPQPRQLSVAAFRTSDSRYLGSEATDRAPVRASSDNGDLFEVTSWGPDQIALKPVRSGRYLSAKPGEPAAAIATEIGDTETFTLIRHEGNQVALCLPDGAHYLSVSPDGEVRASATGAGASELFTLETLDFSALPTGGHGCCDAWTRETEEEAGILWNDKTHARIVELAVNGLKDPAIQTTEARRFAGLWANQSFETKLYQGLKDADYKDPWAGYPIHAYIPGIITLPIKITNMYQNHFYSPATGKNFMGEASSAVTEGRRYFNLAVHAGMRIVQLGNGAPAALYEKAGYYLGLSLHFLTDLTQPMHAANFGNVFADHFPGPLPDFRHKNFEDHTEDAVGRILGHGSNNTSVTARDLFIDDIEDARWFLHNTAVNQKRVYDTILKKVIDTKGFLSPWNDDDGKATWDAALIKAPGAVARYLAYWSKCITQTWGVSHQRWYRIKEPTLGENICLVGGGTFKRSPDMSGHSKYFLLFNEDGSWSLATQDWKRNLWFMKWDGGLVEYKDASGEPVAAARFRFVRNAPGSEQIWIFEATMDEVIGVDAPRGGLCVRWPPNDPKTQLFRFEDAGEISDKEQDAIRESFSHYGRWPWYGGAA